MARVVDIVDGASAHEIVHLDVLGLADEFIAALELAGQRASPFRHVPCGIVMAATLTIIGVAVVVSVRLG